MKKAFFAAAENAIPFYSYAFQMRCPVNCVAVNIISGSYDTI